MAERSGKITEAERHYQQALGIDPNNADALVGRARLKDRQGQLDQATRLYEQASQAHPDNASLLNDLGLCLARQRKYKESIAALDRAISAIELCTLLLLGVCTAALTAFAEFRLGIPGSNIIRVVFPIALGLALVPRRGAASVMGLSGMFAGGVFCMGGAVIGFGAATSLALTGILIDVALRGARSGRGIYIRLMAAGLAVNMAAFFIRAGAKIVLGPGLTGKPLA